MSIHISKAKEALYAKRKEEKMWNDKYCELSIENKRLQVENIELKEYKKEYDELSVLYTELKEEYADDMGEKEEEIEKLKKENSIKENERVEALNKCLIYLDNIDELNFENKNLKEQIRLLKQENEELKKNKKK